MKWSFRKVIFYLYKSNFWIALQLKVKHFNLYISKFLSKTSVFEGLWPSRQVTTRTRRSVVGSSTLGPLFENPYISNSIYLNLHISKPFLKTPVIKKTPSLKIQIWEVWLYCLPWKYINLFVVIVGCVVPRKNACFKWSLYYSS